jgi:hypothetical protein
MPTISWFYGIAIRMYFLDHPPPHFEAAYGEHEANIAIESGDVTRDIYRRPRHASLSNGRSRTRPN